MIGYLATLDMQPIGEIDILVQVLQGGLEVVDGSRIYNESLVITSFLSTIVVQDSVISGITYGDTPFSAISTTMILNNVTIENVSCTSNGQISFLEITSGTLNSIDLTFNTGNSRMIQVLFSQASFSQTSFTNIQSDSNLISALNSDSFDLQHLSLQNSSVSTSSYLSIKNSANIVISSLTLKNLPFTLITFENSQIAKISLVQISESRQIFSVSQSEILEFSQSIFEGNSVTGTGRGGVLAILNSKVRFLNVTFVNNSAFAGGAVTFECTGLQG